MRYADLILPIAIPAPLTYGIPIEWQGSLKIGMRVEVQMGRNKLYAAIVFRIHDEKPENYAIKPIRNILDQEPLISSTQLELWQWVSSYYMCSLGEVMQAALPAHFKLMNESVLVWNSSNDDVPVGLSDDAFLIAEVLYHKQSLTLEETRQLLNGRNLAKVIDELLVNEVVYIQESLEERYRPKMERRVYLQPSYKDESNQSVLVNGMERSPKQLALFFSFLEMQKKLGYVPAADLLKRADASSTQLNALVKKGVFTITEVAIDRLQLPQDQPLKELELDHYQSSVLEEIRQSWQDKDVVLLHGVTGSGKTMIYIDLIRVAIHKGQQVLLLLPEIALTTQVVRRLSEFFGSEMGVYHSRFSDNERVEIWNNVKNKTYSVVVGARSALWLPFADLSLIIVDEEHETSYKQNDPAPRFQARDTAIMYSQMIGAKVLLGSATPSIESYQNAVENKYGLVELGRRYADAAMPEVRIISAKDYIPALSNIITKTMLDEIALTINSDRQVILFQNKRGYAPFLICVGCGWVAKCRQCDVSLTYHKHSDKMHCHYCGLKYQRVVVCEQCGQPKVSARSFGTERVEEELNRVFKNAKIGRLDWDVAKGKNAYNQILNDFESGKIQILVGTQMVVKGLDFERVGLVGVLSADSLLGYPDYRVNERGFQLLEQVAGRAGRRDILGQVLIQAYQMTHPVLQQVCAHDYRSFFVKEIAERKINHYPPFVRFIKISIRHRNESVAESASKTITEKVMSLPHIVVNGPAPALVSKIKNQYIFEVWIKSGKGNQQLVELKQKLNHLIQEVKSMRGHSNLYFVCDVDP